MTRRLLQGGLVVTMAGGEDGPADILVENGRIAAIGLGLGITDAEVVDLSGHLVLPGFVDTHRHCWQTGIRGVAADWSLHEYVRHIRMGYARRYRPRDVHASILVGLLEALDSGVTTVADFCHIMNSPDHADAAVAAMTAAGLRTQLYYGFYDVPLAHPAFAAHGDRIRDAERVVSRFAGTPGTGGLGVALTEAKLVTPDQTRAEIEFARAHGIPITAHMGTLSTPDGVDQLGKAGLLGPDILHVHCNFTSDAELLMIRDSGGAVCCTPETELQMGMGFPILDRLLKIGMAPALGIDIVSDYAGDMFTQMRMALQVERALRNEPTLRSGKMPATISPGVRDALAFATVNGARALRRGHEIGSLAVGRQADIIAIGTSGLNFMPPAAPVPSIVLQARPGDVDFVMVDGRIVKRDGRLLGHDLNRLRAEILETQAHLETPSEEDTAGGATVQAYASAIDQIVVDGPAATS